MNYNIHGCDVTKTCVIVRTNCCVELVFTKSLVGEFMTTTVEMAPGWFVHLCTRGKANSGRNTSQCKRQVLQSACYARLRTVVIVLLGYTSENYCVSCGHNLHVYIFVVTTNNE